MSNFNCLISLFTFSSSDHITNIQWTHLGYKNRDEFVVFSVSKW